MDIDNLLKQIGLFWQYPVITEKEFYRQNRGDVNFLPFPWATVIDKNVNLNKLFELLKSITYRSNQYYTCCQHIRFRELEQLWHMLGIDTVYTPHKCLGEDKLGSINLVACPLYAVNLEDETRNQLFKDVSFLKKKRTYFYSFLGGYQPSNYLTDIRLKIFDLNKKGRKDCVIKNTGDWHFNCDVYRGGQDINGKLNEDQSHKVKTKIYNTNLIESRYSLAPSGSGPNSIRFWEALGAGSIPVLLADTLELPKHKLWNKSIVRIKESQINNIDDILEAIGEDEETQRRENCLKLYRYFRNNYKNERIQHTVIHYCCGSYYKGDFGGVARYDYHISKAFPNYKHFTGPSEKNQLLLFLEKCPNPLVITDNHLACDIPNKYEVILVHHGVAETHAVREPGWNGYFCCDGQKKMLYHRAPNRTRIISISQFCTDEFTRLYAETYTKFPIRTILHSSELNESKYKTHWNNTSPIVIGNWKGVNKGEFVVKHLMKKCPQFTFQPLHVYPDENGIDNWNSRKQESYLQSDIFLQLYVIEGNSYATLDALLCGIPIVASDVGLFYKDVPEDCFVKIDWKRINDVEYVEEKLKYAWDHKEELGRKGREWYLANCAFEDWKKKMRDVVFEDLNLGAYIL